MNIALEKYNVKYEQSITDYIVDFFGYHSNLLGKGQRSNFDQAKENISKWTDKKHELYIIFCEKHPVGFIHIWYKGDNVAWIEDIYVEAQCRKKGIGSFAIKEAEKIVSQKDGYTAICIDVVPQNKNALDLYYELGYDSLSLLTIRKELEKNNREDTTEILGKKFRI